MLLVLSFLVDAFLGASSVLVLELLEFHNKFALVELTTVKRFYPFRVFVFYLFGKIVVRVVSHAFTQILERLIISYLSSESVRFTQFFSLFDFQ